MNVALLGCGLIGKKRAAQLPAGALRTVYDPDARRARELALAHPGCAVATTVEEAIGADVQAVLVAAYNAQLAPLAETALRAGRHVLVEKPAAVSLEQLGTLEALSRAGNLRVRVGYNHRYHPAALKARELWDSGVLGPMMFVRGRYGHGGRAGYDREWRADRRLSGGGEMIDQGVHLVDLAGMFLGDFTAIDGHLATYFWDMPVEDNAFISLRNAAGATAWLHASCTEWKNLFSLEIYGKHGKLHWEGLGGSYGVERLVWYRMLPEMGPPETKVWEYPRGDESWRLEMGEFFEDIRTGREPVPGLREARRALAVVEELSARFAGGTTS